MGYPLTFGMPVYTEFLSLNKKNSIMLSNPKGYFLGYHGMVIFGWDDDKGWHVRNSWGEDWGDNGNCWIPYDYPLREVWLLIDKLVPIEKSRRYNRTIKKIVIHHIGDGQDTSVSITSRWNKYGYEYPQYDIGIEGNGKVIQGRPLNVIGAHAIATYQKYTTGEYYDSENNWWNKNSLSIALAGDFTVTAMPQVMFNSLVSETKKQMRIHGLMPKDVLPHKEITATSCPGDNWSWKKFIEEISKEDDEMEVAVVYWSLRDFSAAYMVANAYGSCGMFCRNERVDNIHPDAKKAKKLIVIGGPKYYDHPNVTNLSGEGSPETQIEAAKYVQSLRK